MEYGKRAHRGLLLVAIDLFYGIFTFLFRFSPGPTHTDRTVRLYRPDYRAVYRQSHACHMHAHGVSTHTRLETRTHGTTTRALRVSDSDMKNPKRKLKVKLHGCRCWFTPGRHIYHANIMHGIRGRRGNGRWSLGWAWRRAVAGPRGAAGRRQVGCHSGPEDLPTEASNIQALLSNNPPGAAGEQRAASAVTSPWWGENNLDVISSNVI